MKLLWTFVKVVLALALLVPISIIVLSTALGALGALLGLAFVVLRFAIFGLVLYGAFRIAAALFGWSKSPEPMPVVKHLPRPDPYYEAAKRELDQELGDAR